MIMEFRPIWSHLFVHPTVLTYCIFEKSSYIHWLDH
jgi:hypothetical protein